MGWPSIKLARPVVSITGADQARELQHARARVADLERTDADVEQQITRRYVLGLHEERRSALIRLAHCEAHDADAHERVDDARAELSWGQRAEACRRHIEQIDAELERLSSSSRA
jgi:hypothetical protein